MIRHRRRSSTTRPTHSDDPHSRRADHGESWAVKALISTIAGLMFSLVLGIALLCLQRSGVLGLRELEQRGIDLGMWFFVRHIADRQEDSDPHDRQYAFVDVDIAACHAFTAARATDCEVANPVNTAMILDFVRAMAAAGAKVVIVDAQLDTADKVLKEGLAALKTGPWVVVPPNARPAMSARRTASP